LHHIPASHNFNFISVKGPQTDIFNVMPDLATAYVTATDIQNFPFNIDSSQSVAFFKAIQTL
jgi:hypothetical protein